MKRDVDAHFVWIKRIIKEIDTYVPESVVGTEAFRSDLAGLLCVTIAAAYENSAKDSMIRCAATRHLDFEFFVSKNFDRLNSRVRVHDLKKYASLFSQDGGSSFSLALKQRKARILGSSRVNCEASFEQLLDWRHGYAHSGQLNTTISEVVKSHRAAKHILYAFEQALNPLTHPSSAPR